MPLAELSTWVLVPFSSFGPVQFNRSLEQMVEDLGAPDARRATGGLDEGYELVYRTGKATRGREVKLWFDREGGFEFLMFEGASSFLVRGPTGDEPFDLENRQDVVPLSANLRAVPALGVTAFRKEGTPGGPASSPLRISINTFEYMNGLAPQPEPPPPPTAEEAARAAKLRKNAPSVPAFLKSSKAFQRLRREAFVPVLKNRPDDVNRSKLNGAPWLPQNAPTPRCPECKQPFSLIVQLFSEDLPTRDTFEGVLQYLVCIEGECHLDDVPGSAQVRVLPVPKKKEPARKVKARAPTSEEEVQVISGWRKRQDDFPDVSEDQQAADALTSAFGDANRYQDLYPISGTKLLGWANWVQDPATPTCKHCLTVDHMRLLLQVTEREAENVWGTLFFFQCQKHSSVFEVVEQST